MSYDFWMEECDSTLDENYTSNVGCMFFEAFGEPGIRKINGLPGHQAAAQVLAALTRMAANPKKYRGMNPENGWGDFDGAVSLLMKLREEYLDHPHGVAKVGY